MLAALNVAYRDFRYVHSLLVQLGMFATPTVYMEVAVESPRAAVAVAVEVRRDVPVAAGQGRPRLPFPHSVGPESNDRPDCRVSGRGPGRSRAVRLGYSLLSVAFLCVGGCLYYRKVEDSFADII